MSFFNTFLMAFAYIALFVGMFIIYNTFSIIIAQRMREMAMLRAVGASRRQVLRVGAARVRHRRCGRLGRRPRRRRADVLRPPRAPRGRRPRDPERRRGHHQRDDHDGLRRRHHRDDAVLGRPGPPGQPHQPDRRPAGHRHREHHHVAPAHGARPRHPRCRRRRLRRRHHRLRPRMPSRLLGLGVLAAILGVFVLGPVIARPAMHVLGAPTKVSGATGHLARENAKRNPRRSAATASALMIGVALVGFITILASSTKASTAAAVDTSLRADYVVDSGSWGDGGFGPSIEDDLAALPEVESLSPRRSVPVDDRRRHAPRSRRSTPPPSSELVDLEVTAGAIEDVHGDGLALDVDKADELGVGIGDTVTVGFSATGDVELTVRALFDGDLLGAGGMDHIVGPRHLRGQRHRRVRPAGVPDDRRRRRRRHLEGGHRGGRSRAGRTPSCRTRPASRSRSPRRST